MQQGASLVELMISMLLGAISITALGTLVAHGIGLNSQLIAIFRFDAEVDAVMAMVMTDLRRAGYRQLSVYEPNTRGIDQGQVMVPDITLSSYSSELANSCISFAYDRNKNGRLDSDFGNEYLGYRLHNNSIEIRMSGLACSAPKWQDITDPKTLSIETLTFTKQRSASSALFSIKLTVHLQANSIAYPGISRQLTRTVLVKNHER
jgi:prepilin peptidase dependent protein B